MKAIVYQGPGKKAPESIPARSRCWRQSCQQDRSGQHGQSGCRITDMLRRAVTERFDREEYAAYCVAGLSGNLADAGG